MIQVLVVEDSRITRDAIESQIAKSERYVLYASIEKCSQCRNCLSAWKCRFNLDGCMYG